MKLNQTAKQFKIPKRLVWEAYLKVKRKRGAAGVDGVTLDDLVATTRVIWKILTK